MRSHPRARPAVRWAVACVALTMAVTSCGDDDASSGDTTTTTSASSAPTEPSSGADSTEASDGDAICADREALSTAVDGLSDVDVVAEGTNGVTEAAAEVSTALESLQESAGEELQPQVQAVQDGIDQLETAAADIDSEGATPALTAIADVATSAATLLTSLDDGACA